LKYLLIDNWGGRLHDAKKTVASTEDDLMCWAAAASNILAWTRWGFPTTESFASEDAIFSYFQDHWIDQTGHPQEAWKWWFNVVDEDWMDQNGVDVSGGGFWDESYNLDDYYHVEWNRTNALSAIDDFLRSGYGVSLNLISQSGGHCITCWGYEYDDQDNYVGIYVTDSDDASPGLKYYELTRTGWSYEGWWYFQKNSVEFLIGDVQALDRLPDAPSAPSNLRITSNE